MNIYWTESFVPRYDINYYWMYSGEEIIWRIIKDNNSDIIYLDLDDKVYFESLDQGKSYCVSKFISDHRLSNINSIIDS